jgi:RsmE family RNA methyltransferase
VNPVTFNQFLKVHAHKTKQLASATGSSGQKDDARDLFFICAERQEVSPLVKALSERIYKTDTSSIRSIDSITLLVGPEGGFSNEELHDALDSGWQSVSLGNRILRSETAAIAAMCQIASILDI